MIAKHSLDTSLDHLGEPLRKIEEIYKPSALSFDGSVDVQVLQRVAHTYRHDLDFSKYCCGSALAAHGGFRCIVTDRSKESILTSWYSRSFKAIAGRKEHAMGINGFKELFGEFPEVFNYVKPLCKEIRGILFPLHPELYRIHPDFYMTTSLKRLTLLIISASI